MKKLLLLLAIGLTTIAAKTQDVILTRKGDEIKSRITEVGLTTIKYKKFDNPNGPIYEISKTEVFMVKYENGSKDVFTDSVKTTLSPANESFQICEQAKVDAKKYYKRGNDAAAGTLFTTLFIGPIIGLIPAIITSSTNPRDKSLDAPNPQLMKDVNYNKCYRQRAKGIKSGKVWTCWGIGLAINVAVVAILLQAN